MLPQALIEWSENEHRIDLLLKNLFYLTISLAARPF